MDDDDPLHFIGALDGRPLCGGWDRIPRYCGLSWSGGQPETWAYRFCDTVTTDPSALHPEDVPPVAALHPGLSRADLTWFSDHAGEVGAWLAELENRTGRPLTHLRLLDKCIWMGGRS